MIPTRPIVIAHRGASGHRPEHTLAAYRLAIRMGADFVEPDLVSTRDGVLVARHENEIGATTDVADHPELADRRTTKVVDGREVTGWFTEDLTLAELKTLRARERLPLVRPHNTRYDGHLEVPTFEEVLALVREESRRAGRRIGVYPETKHPTYFASLGLPLEPPLLRSLHRHGWDGPGAPVLVQSFESGNLRELATRTSLPLVQLIGAESSYDAMVTPAGLAEVATYARAVGVHKARIPLVAEAHAAGLLVHVWTLRDEPQFRVAGHRSAGTEARAFLDAGVDGLFCDHPATGVQAVEDWLTQQPSTA